MEDPSEEQRHQQAIQSTGHLCQDKGEHLDLRQWLGVRVTPLSDPVSDLQYTCLAVSSRYVALGANTGGVYCFSARDFKYLRLLTNKVSGDKEISVFMILCVCVCVCRRAEHR